MKCTVVIATYNRSSSLLESVRSVLEQTYQDIEVVIIDDGSTDDTVTILQALVQVDRRVRFFCLPKNGGASIARNRGIAEARGDLIMVWDSDDILYPQTIARVVAIFAQQPGLSVVSGPCTQVRNGVVVPYVQHPSGEVTTAQILCKCIPSNEKVRVARAGVYKQVLYQSRNIDFIVSGYLAEQGRWYHLQEELGEVRLQYDEVSLTGSRKKPNIDRSMERAPHLVAYLNRFGDQLCDSCPILYAAHAYGASLGLILLGKKKEARVLLRRAITVYPRLLRCWLVYGIALLPGATFLVKKLFTMRA